MKLNVHERLIAIGLLPKEGNSTNLRLIRKAKEELSFSEEEHRALKFRVKGDQIVWDQAGNCEKDIYVGEVASAMIGKALKDLEAKEKLTMEHLSLYEKFCEKGKNNEPE